MNALMQLPIARSRSRRKGQALILAVLVMLFAVLLSTAFLVVVGNTGRQVGRETDSSEATRNAEKGVAFVISRLQAANNPDTWSPISDTAIVKSTDPVPPPGSADYSLYYSALDKTMGWAQQGYAKYPDPRTSRQAPQFLVNSRLLGLNPADDADGGDKRFMLRITVIGLSSKDPDLWTRRVLYKTTNWNGGTFSYANFVTSFDPDTQKSITSTLAGTLNANQTLGQTITIPVYGALGSGSERTTYSARITSPGSTLMVSDGKHQPLVAIVRSFDPNNDAVITSNSTIYNIKARVLQGPVGAATDNFLPNAKVSLVGSLFESPTNIDANGDSNGVTTPTSTEGAMSLQTIFGVGGAADTSTTPLGNGAQFNGGLNVPFRTQFAARPPVASYTGSTTLAGQNSLSASGPMSVGDPTPTPANTPIGIFLVGATPGPTPIFIPQASSPQNQFLQVAYNQQGQPLVSTANSAVAPSIVPRSVKPAAIDLAAYRAQTQSGWFINNPDDVEKFNGQPLTTSQLQRLWQRKSFVTTAGKGNVAAFADGAAPTTPIQGGTDAVRLCYGRPATPAGVTPAFTGDTYLYPLASGGLEARGIRGWISPWEFLPRGTQIILNGATSKITIIQDPLSDRSPNAPDLTKAVDVASHKFFNTELDPPTNGIIVAAGNVRVSGLGTWTGAPLTIVSGNNIYIEGPLVAPTAKIGLLAKKNVVLNPTQFVSRPRQTLNASSQIISVGGTVDTSVGQNAISGVVVNGAATFDTTKFKLGDQVAVFVPGKPADGWRSVIGIAANSVTFDRAVDLSGVPDNTKIKLKLACDPPIVLLKDNPDSTTDYFQGHTTAGTANDARNQELDPLSNAPSTGTSYAYKFAQGGDTLIRNAPFGATVGVGMSQAAEKKNVIFTVKGGDDPSQNPPIVDNGERRLVTKDTANPFQLLLHPKSGLAANPSQDQTYDLNQIVSGSSGDTNATLNALRSDLQAAAPNDTDTKYNRWRIVLPTPVPIATAGPFDSVPARRLAKASIALSPLDSGAQTNEETTPTTFRVPLTSSVLLFNSDLPATDPAATNVLLRFGSTFGYQSTVPTTPTAEDPTTVDADFYGNLPKWNLAADTATSDNSVTYPIVSTNTADPDTFAFTRDGAGDFNDALPAYYMSVVRFQKVDSSGKSTATTPNMTVEVDATIYAEGGSWFVIPNPATTSYDSTRSLDENTEWRRPNYQIIVNGNIAQMMTPSATIDYDDEPDSDSVAMGAMKRWTDSLAYQPASGTWQTIQYNAAPLRALDSSTPTGVALTPQLPSSSDILYTYSN